MEFFGREKEMEGYFFRMLPKNIWIWLLMKYRSSSMSARAFLQICRNCGTDIRVRWKLTLSLVALFIFWWGSCLRTRKLLCMDVWRNAWSYCLSALKKNNRSLRCQDLHSLMLSIQLKDSIYRKNIKLKCEQRG